MTVIRHQTDVSPFTVTRSTEVVNIGGLCCCDASSLSRSLFPPPLPSSKRLWIAASLTNIHLAYFAILRCRSLKPLKAFPIDSLWTNIQTMNALFIRCCRCLWSKQNHFLSHLNICAGKKHRVNEKSCWKAGFLWLCHSMSDDVRSFHKQFFILFFWLNANVRNDIFIGQTCRDYERWVFNGSRKWAVWVRCAREIGLVFGSFSKFPEVCRVFSSTNLIEV